MTKKTKMILGIAAAVLIVAVIVYLALQQKKSGGSTETGNGTANEPTEEMLASQTPEAAQATQKLIDEATDKQSATRTITVSEPAVAGATSTSVKEIKVVTVAPGTNPIDVSTGKVITEAGKVVNNAAAPASPEAPQQSFPMKVEEAPKSAVKLKVTSNSFTPNTFTVNRGQVVNLVVSNVNETTFSEVFRFDEPSLSAVVLGLAKGETKSISFNAPSKAGEYAFYSSMFDHRAQGAVGKMIVK